MNVLWNDQTFPESIKKRATYSLYIKPARTNARTCTTRTCTATSTTFRYDRILVSLSPSFPLRSFPPESPPNFLTPTTHPTDNQAPELEALVQSIAGIRGIDAVAAAAADTAVVVPTLTIGSDTQKLHVAARRQAGRALRCNRQAPNQHIRQVPGSLAPFGQAFGVYSDTH